jgi:hypothetical protein
MSFMSLLSPLTVYDKVFGLLILLLVPFTCCALRCANDRLLGGCWGRRDSASLDEGAFWTFGRVFWSIAAVVDGL